MGLFFMAVSLQSSEKEVYLKYITRLLPPTKWDSITAEEISQLANKDLFFFKLCCQTALNYRGLTGFVYGKKLY